MQAPFSYGYNLNGHMYVSCCLVRWQQLQNTTDSRYLIGFCSQNVSIELKLHFFWRLNFVLQWFLSCPCAHVKPAWEQTPCLVTKVVSNNP